MNIIRWTPFDGVGTLERSMDRMLDEFFSLRPARDLAALEREPAVEMFETEQDVVVRAEMPNVDPKNVDVTVTDGAITLRGQTKHEEEQKGRNYYRRELRSGSFTRTLPLPTEVKSAEAKATYKDGMLEVKIPKSERVRPTSVKVQVD
ncbi:MAG: Hsp20/alpha crystallin family protein [Bacillati bacterium ANGP1]|uniref:Hsp20/alpha crystallin family protein n=1 Tax=Candidatus Segetimicrobium genomatis TaxID=2569760 RepID=A0A537JKT4_9BACT|nr:MAG: Hsp20/alpha crystallin family protein [Terrabacteria group bacterium ANGP1]